LLLPAAPKSPPARCGHIPAAKSPYPGKRSAPAPSPFATGGASEDVRRIRILNFTDLQKQKFIPIFVYGSRLHIHGVPFPDQTVEPKPHFEKAAHLSCHLPTAAPLSPKMHYGSLKGK